MQFKYLNDKYGKAFLVGGSLFIWLLFYCFSKTMDILKPGNCGKFPRNRLHSQTSD